MNWSDQISQAFRTLMSAALYVARSGRAFILSNKAATQEVGVYFRELVSEFRAIEELALLFLTSSLSRESSADSIDTCKS